jgi:hypothetical protein
MICLDEPSLAGRSLEAESAVSFRVLFNARPLILESLFEALPTFDAAFPLGGAFLPAVSLPDPKFLLDLEFSFASPCLSEPAS